MRRFLAGVILGMLITSALAVYGITHIQLGDAQKTITAGSSILSTAFDFSHLFAH